MRRVICLHNADGRPCFFSALDIDKIDTTEEGLTSVTFTISVKETPAQVRQIVKDA